MLKGVKLHVVIYSISKDFSVSSTALQKPPTTSVGRTLWLLKSPVMQDVKSHYVINFNICLQINIRLLLQHLDHEESPLKNLTISVENEIPYYSCKVVSPSTTGLWEVVTVLGATGSETLRLSTFQVTVVVEDVNEPPVFNKPNKQVKLGENVEPGQYLETFVAKDPDINSANTFV